MPLMRIVCVLAYSTSTWSVFEPSGRNFPEFAREFEAIVTWFDVQYLHDRLDW